MRSAALILGLLSLLPATDAVAQEADTLADDLAQCRELVGRRSWKKGRAAYEELLAKHEGDARAVAVAASIERDLQLCIFNLGRRPPSGEALFGPNVVKFSASSRRIDLVFEKGLDDEPWESMQGSFKMLPMRFTDDVVVTVPADGSKSRLTDDSAFDSEEQVRVRALLALNPERSGGYLAIAPYGSRIFDDDYRKHSDPTYAVPWMLRIFDLAESPPKLLKIDSWWTRRPTIGKPRGRWVRISHKGSLIRIEAERSAPLAARDGKHDGGYLAVSASWVRGSRSRPLSVRVQGEIDRTYLTKRVAQFEDAAFQKWKDEGYDREATLPEWMRDGGGIRAATSVALPADLPEEHREHVGAFLSWVLSSETTTEMELPDPSVLPLHSAALVAGALALMRGELRAAEGHFTALIGADPAFHAALLWRARTRYYRRAMDAADADLAAAKEHLSNDPAYHELVVSVHVARGDLDGAREALDAARASGAWTERLAEFAVGVDAAARGPHWRRTFRKKTRIFEVLSDHSQEMCQDVSTVLGDAVRRFAKSFRTVPEKRHPARVYVFSSKDAYDDFAAEVGSSLTHSAGAYLPRLHILVIWMPVDRRDFEATVRHEGFHQYLHDFVDDVPLWFNEGHAEFFGNLPVERTALGHETDLAGIAARVKQHRAAFVPLPELMKMSRTAFMSNASPRYAQAWAAVTFLKTTDGELRGRMDRYFDALLAGRSRDEAYADAFADVEPALTADWNAFLDAL